MSDNYHDVDGNRVSLDTLCRKEPAWAANVIRTLKTELAVAKAALEQEEHHTTELCRELNSYKAGVEVEGYVTGVPTDINKDLYFASGWSRKLNAFSNKRVRVLVRAKEGV